MNKQRTAEGVIALLAGFAAFAMFFLFLQEASAQPPNKEPPVADTPGQVQGQTQEATANSDSVSTATANSDATSDATADAQSSNEGNELKVEGDTVENNSSTVVLVPNNNTESCVRVFGLAFGKNGESGAIGIPWRSKKCDFEQAADDAFAGGERDLGWFWKCQNKNLYKQFQSKDESVESAISDCHTRMLATTSTDEVVRRLEERLKATENMLELEQSHKQVCDESLERCEQKLYRK